MVYHGCGRTSSTMTVDALLLPRAVGRRDVLKLSLEVYCWFQPETLRFFSPILDSHLRLRNSLLRRSVLIHPPGRFRVLISMAYSKFALNESDSDSDWGDSSSESSSDSDESDDSDWDVFKIRRGVLQTTLFPD